MSADVTASSEHSAVGPLIAGLEHLVSMREVTYEEYLRFKTQRDEVVVGGVSLSLNVAPSRHIHPPEFEVERSTVWSFPKRGDWATHKHNSRYRGNWAPQVARNLILLYSKEGDLVLDPFMGSGTTIIECKLLRRRCIGVDVNYESVMLAWSRLDFSWEGDPPYARVKLYHGDARNLDGIDSESVDLVATHPPYADIIKYGSRDSWQGDLSRLGVREYLAEMGRVAEELYRVLKPGGILAIMVGDKREKKHVVPLGYMVMRIFLEAGFIIKEHIIKVQHNMLGTVAWRRRRNDFLLLAHEHIFVFRKPESYGELRKFRWSSALALTSWRAPALPETGLEHE